MKAFPCSSVRDELMIEKQLEVELPIEKPQLFLESTPEWDTLTEISINYFQNMLRKRPELSRENETDLLLRINIRYITFIQI